MISGRTACGCGRKEADRNPQSFPLKGGRADSWNDHRIAMMAAIASLLCREKVVLTGSDAVQKSYPGFFEDLKKLGLEHNLERN